MIQERGIPLRGNPDSRSVLGSGVRIYFGETCDLQTNRHIRLSAIKMIRESFRVNQIWCDTRLAQLYIEFIYEVIDFFLSRPQLKYLLKQEKRLTRHSHILFLVLSTTGITGMSNS